jgi:hypothetical protein
MSGTGLEPVTPAVELVQAVNGLTTTANGAHRKRQQPCGIGALRLSIHADPGFAEESLGRRLLFAPLAPLALLLFAPMLLPGKDAWMERKIQTQLGRIAPRTFGSTPSSTAT